MTRLTATELNRSARSAVVLAPWCLGLLLLGSIGCSTGGGTPTRGDAGPGWMTLDSGFSSVDAGDGSDAGTDGGPAPGDGGMDDGGLSTDGGPPPTIKSLTPPLGTVNGGTNVVIFGTGFVNGFSDQGGATVNAQTSVFFGNQQVPINGGVTVIDDSTMEVVTPPGLAGQVDVMVQNPNGSVTCHDCFTFISNIIISRLSVTTGSTLGGDPLSIFGQGFAPGMMVLIGGYEATVMNVSADGTEIDVITPPGNAGSADVAVVGPNSDGFLRRGFVYVAPIQVTGVTPAASPLAGGGAITVSGTGFTADSQVSLGSQPATTTYVSSTQLTAIVPAATASGSVNVIVTTARATGTLANGFAYYDDSRDPQIFAVVPMQGPVAGGISAQLVGTGLSASDGLQVKFGANDATITGGDANVVTVTVPAAQAAGVVDVQARTTRGGAMLPQAFGYVTPLSLTGITPTTAPASGTPATTATIDGAGLNASCQVLVGSAQATVTGAAQDGSSISITVPPGTAGQRDVRVACGTPGSVMFQQATLAGGLTYTVPLQLLNVDPNTGAIAGNTAVTLYGSGFQNGMTVSFGTGAATMVQVQSPSIAVVRTPPGNVGYVDVKVQTSTDQNTLRNAFGYYDPKSVLGGGSGGPMLGILNVTVLNSTPGQSGPVAGVTISVNADQLVGVTDQRGQVTFSDPSLLKSVTITGSKMGFAAATIAHINARNVTLFMQMNMGGPPSPGGMPPGPATFTGRVCGFKVAPDTVLSHGQRLEAHVFPSFPYVYAAPPFGILPSPVVVATDCGAYKLETTQYGPLALWAEFGIADSTTTPPSFRPLLMGVIRGLEADPDKTVSGKDIILDMHLDETFPVTIDESDLGLAGTTAIMNQVFSYLDLGGEGVIPLGQTQSTSAGPFPFANHPRVEGQGLVFLNLASEFDTTTGSATPPYSLCFRRQYGELSAGVTIGPMMSFTKWISPMPNDIFTGTMSWAFLSGSPADLVQLDVSQPMGFVSVPILDVILPGTDQSVTIPMSASSSFPPGALLQWTLITAESPRFQYNSFSFQQLGVNEWTSFTEDFGTFQTAQ